MFKRVCAVLVVLAPMVALAQSNSADQQKITDIEQKFAAINNFNSPEMTDALQKYLYNGTTSSVGQFGRLYRMDKAKVVEMTKKPDPSDPDVRATTKLTDLQVDVLGDAAVATYKEVNTETGHKEAALNGDYALTCVDSFVKRKGQWYFISNACVPSTALSQAQWDAVMKMRAAEPPQQ
jgi:uncharacterized membrane protein YvbJ